jgi:hypothetical protein
LSRLCVALRLKAANFVPQLCNSLIQNGDRSQERRPPGQEQFRLAPHYRRQIAVGLTTAHFIRK